MNAQNQKTVQEESRWLRVGLLILTLLTPIINTIVERIRQRSQSLREQAKGLQTSTQSAQTTVKHRLDKFAGISRQHALEQAQQLQLQAQHLQEQAHHLRTALGENAEQSRKVAEQMLQTSEEWGQQLLKRGEQFTEELSERGSKLVEQGGKLTHGLAERGGKLAHELGEDLLEPIRKRDKTFWTVLGFSIGLTAALVATYLFVRQRMIQQVAHADQQIELPQNGYQARPAKEQQAPMGKGAYVERNAVERGGERMS